MRSLVEKEGVDNTILEINNAWICKSSKTATGSEYLKIETHLLKLIENKLSTKIPIVKYYESNFLMYKKIPGIELSRELYNSATPEQKERLAHQIAFFLYEFHNAVTPDEAKKIGLHPTDWPWSPEKLLSEKHAIDGQKLNDIFTQFISEYTLARNAPHVITIIHNDVAPRNIIVDEKTRALKGIIDFTDIAVDDSYLDLRMRQDSIPELTVAIAKKYAALTNTPCTLQKIYIYYLATEFSRYVHLKKENKLNDLEIITERIISAALSLN